MLEIDAGKGAPSPGSTGRASGAELLAATSTLYALANGRPGLTLGVR
ncbi:MAG TPA: hypothetical protein VEJ84_00710 [Acidimicrobiales bacterium]|nr:hypothetical protein [Acidimicrobiales bacterium]